MALEPRPPLAIVGVSALFPGSSDTGSFWRDILTGRDLITDVPPTHWLAEDYYDPDPQAPDKTYARRGAFLSPVEFDPLEHGVPPSVVPATDTTQLLALIVAKRVLEDATRGRFEAIDRERVSVILGATSALELLVSAGSRLQRPVWLKALREEGVAEDEAQRVCDRIAGSYVPWQENTFPGLLGNVIAGRIANRLNLGGKNFVTDAACASALSAVAMAANELYVGDSDLVITGGVDTFNDIFMYMCFSKTPALSPTGDCRPFAKSGDGTMLGEGLGLFALRRLADAERDGNRIYAVLRGVGSSSDGRAKSVYAPVPEGQAKALRRAYEAAGYGPDTVTLVEAHGTATKAGDVAEFEGLRQVFAATGRSDRGWCALGSVKSQIGHTKAAAGAAGLFKVVMALHHKVLPPTIKVDEPNPALGLEDSPFYLNTESRPWIHAPSQPRRAAVSAFGFGGSNFHATLEEYRGDGAKPHRVRTVPSELIVLSGADPASLESACRTWAARDDAGLEHIARVTQESFDPALPARLAVVANDVPDLRRKLLQAGDGIARDGETAFTSPSGIHYAFGAEPGRIALLFPGQGSQYTGMGADLAMAFDACRAVWDTVSSVPLDAGHGLAEVVFPRPVFDDAARARLFERLTRTEWAQPALGAAGVAALALLDRLGLHSSVVAGHSFGELTALYAAGAFTLPDLVRVARRRGEVMAAAPDRAGAMLAVASDAESVGRSLGGRPELVIANLNSPKQTVVSGPADAIDALAATLEARRIGVRRLPVSTAFHSPLMESAGSAFGDFLERVAVAPLRDGAEVMAGAEAAPYPRDSESIRRRLKEQITQPVRFAETIEALYARGVRTFVEVGPGSVLTGLVGECLAQRPHRAVAIDRRGQHGVTSLWNALGRLTVGGTRIQFEALWDGAAAAEEAARRPKSAASLAISGANYGKPYPPAGGHAALPKPNVRRVPGKAVASRALAPTNGKAAGASAGDPDTDAHAPVAVPPPLERAPVSEAAAALQKPIVMPPAPSGVAIASDLEPRPGSTLRASAPNAAAVPSVLIQAYQEIQRQTAEAHAQFQRLMAESHSVFLQAAETSLAALTALVTGRAPEQAAALGSTSQDESAGAATRTQPQSPVSIASSLLPLPSFLTGAAEPHAPIDGAGGARATGSEPAPATTTAPHHANLQEILCAIVSEKTGYPAEMLAPEMELEGDLGIDSIKRVEILAALQDRVAGLPQVSASELGALKTLGQIGERLGAVPVAAAPPAEHAQPAPHATAVAASEPASDDLVALLRRVVSEKTGYPAEMLAPEMQLEGDLGIDSIKRVEILGALQDRRPGLPQVSASELGALRTLGAIAERLGGVPVKDARPAASRAVSLGSLPLPLSREAATQIARFALRELAAPAAGLAMAGLFTSGLVAITDDGAGVSGALSARLQEAGLDARVVQSIPADAGAVVFLGGLRAVADVSQAIAVNREAFRAAKAVATAFSERGGVFVTVQDTNGDFARSGRAQARSWLAGLPALVKTAAKEWSRSSVKAIDIAQGERGPREVADAIASELLAGGLETEVGLPADGRRTTLASVPLPVRPGAPRIDSSSVLLVSGGARGVTPACLLELARRHQPRLALLGRTRLVEEPAELQGIDDAAGLGRALLAAAQARGEGLGPAALRAAVAGVLAVREVRATLAALRSAGARAEYFAVDVRDAHALGQTLLRVRRDLGPITGLVHAAGVLADKRIKDKTLEAFDGVFETKVEGLRGLLDATAEDRLHVVALFSSVAARSGNAGQSDYAMANEVLNAVAAAEARRRGGACRVVSIGWGPWDGGMVDPALKMSFAARGVPLLDPLEGARRFVEEIECTSGESEVVIAGATGVVAAEPMRSEATVEVHVSARTHPFLASHRVADAPVVPVAVVLEWFARAAHACRPDLALRACEDVAVLKGIRLERFENGGDAFSVRCRQIANGEGARLALELVGAHGTLHYTATAEMAPRRATNRTHAADSAVGRTNGNGHGAGQAADTPVPPGVYGDVLFHGPDFQVIRTLEGMAPAGSSAILAGVREQRWDGPWRVDAAALDGGLQLALLWAYHTIGKKTLPTRVGAFVSHADDPLEGPIRCVLSARDASRQRTLSDLVFTAEDGRLLAELRGVETHAYAAGDASDAG